MQLNVDRTGPDHRKRQRGGRSRGSPVVQRVSPGHTGAAACHAPRCGRACTGGGGTHRQATPAREAV